MPSHSKEQAHTMSAIAHGWTPPAGSKVAKIPVDVAKDFHAADKKVGKWEHPTKVTKRAKGGTIKCSTPFNY
jgi:hypothetical protein